MKFFSDIFNAGKKAPEADPLLERLQRIQAFEDSLVETTGFLNRLSTAMGERITYGSVVEGSLAVTFNADNGNYAAGFYLERDRAGGYVVFKTGNSLHYDTEVMLGYRPNEGPAPGTVKCATPQQAIDAISDYMKVKLLHEYGQAAMPLVNIITSVAAAELDTVHDRLRDNAASLRAAAEKLDQAVDAMAAGTVAVEAQPQSGALTAPVVVRALPIVGIKPGGNRS